MFGNSIMLRTIGCHVFMSNAAFLEKFDEFFRFELSPVVSSKTFQFSTELILDQGEPIEEDREHPIFSSDKISPLLLSWVVNKTNEVQSTVERLMWHRAIDV